MTKGQLSGPLAALDGYGHVDEEACRRFRAAVELAGRKWNAAILLAAARGARRYIEYRRLVDGISDRVLTERLRELERNRLIERTVTPSTPVLIEYQLTDSGRELLSGLTPLIVWGSRWDVHV